MMIFLGVLFIMFLWEIILPRRPLTTGKAGRWFSNLTIIFLNTVIVRFVAPILPVAMAVVAQKRGWGIFNLYVFPGWIKIVLSIVILDFIIYLQHVMFHTLPPLWRLHLIHHADLDIDVTTGLRFHPIEIIISLGIKISAISLIGAPPLSAIIFEAILNGMAMFNHGNVRLPLRLDRFLRLLVVTPDMHRVHHSVIIRETNSNFGFNLSWWDRLFRTYRDQPVAGHDGMTIGLAQYRDGRKLTLPWLLILPFIADPGKYAINKWGSDPMFRKK